MLMTHRLVPIAIVSLVLAAGCGGGGEDVGSGGRSGGDPAGGQDDGSLVLGRVGPHEITSVEVVTSMYEKMGEERTNLTSRNPDVLSTALAALIDQFVWMEMCKKKGIELTAEDRAKLENLEAQLYTRHYMAEVIDDLVRPAREEVVAAYDENLENYIRPFRVGARHVMVADQTEAKRVLEEFESGAKFTDLARKYSLDGTTGDIGGNLGYVEKGKPVLGLGQEPAFVNAVLDMEEGDAAVLQSQKGWHVVLAEKKEGGEPAPLEEVYRSIETQIAQRRFNTVYNEALEDAREQVGVEFRHDAIAEYTGISNSVETLMASVDGALGPGAQIEIYRRVAFDHAKSEHAPEALFRIAYLQLVELKDAAAAGKSIRRLEKVYPQSDWTKAAVVLREHLEEAETEGLDARMGTPEDILKRVTGSS
jgi:hypothetical protein